MSLIANKKKRAWNPTPEQRKRMRDAWRRRTEAGLRLRLRKYGLTYEQYTQLMADQRSQCAIRGCGVRDLLDIDHDHATGRVRGLLCRRHNGMAGYLERSDVDAVFAYLQRTKR